MTGASPAAVFATALKNEMTPTTVSVRTNPTRNNYGEISYSGSTTSYAAYVRKSTQADRDVSSETAQCDFIAYIPDQSLTLEVDDEITLPAPISGTRPIVRVDLKSNALGQVAVIAYCGRSTKS